MNDIDKRAGILRTLTQGEHPISEAISDLDRFAWDSEEVVILIRRVIVRILRWYIDGIFSAEDVEDWANAIECCEDIGYEPGHEGLLKRAIHDLATPELWDPITRQLARHWIRQLVE